LFYIIKETNKLPSKNSCLLQQDRQYTHNVTLKRVRVTNIIVEMQWVIYIECVSIFLRYLSDMQSVCAVLCCHVWSVPFYHIFPHYLINGKVLWKKVLNIKCVFWFPLQRLF